MKWLLVITAVALAACSQTIQVPPLHQVADPIGLLCCGESKFINRSLPYLQDPRELSMRVQGFTTPSAVKKTLLPILEGSSYREVFLTLEKQGFTCVLRQTTPYGRKRPVQFLCCSLPQDMSPLFIRRWDLRLFLRQNDAVSDILVDPAPPAAIH
jgi:hypothetical protein